MSIANKALGWQPAQFWAATPYEFETAVLTRVREVEPAPWTDEQTRAFFDRLAPSQSNQQDDAPC